MIDDGGDEATLGDEDEEKDGDGDGDGRFSEGLLEVSLTTVEGINHSSQQTARSGWLILHYRYTPGNAAKA
ncbi:hypothetical protein TWF481_003862 [Arthrobotrys musiformis]|uniref:Uncharacterized protein n=1 Tax=Arthrobotrys musiformis TaxID=47236 RepID=A0AAV9WJ52_9PEZI